MTPSTNVLQIQPMLKSKAAHSIQKMASDFGEGNIDINNRYIPHLTELHKMLYKCCFLRHPFKFRSIEI